jgi:hypothetical protein
MMIRTTAALLLLVGAASVPAARAQDAPPESVFQQLFSQPTGQNGYEEIVAAGEMLAKSTLLVNGEKRGLETLSLSQKRLVLADPAVSDALALFRQGIAKALHTPSDKSFETGIKAYGLYRRLARVLVMEQYVCCADGRVGAAIDSSQDQLRLGYAIQRDAMLGGLVGVAIDSLTIREMQRHLDQLSEHDCRRLIQLARAWHDAPDPAIEAMAAERDVILKNLVGQLPVDPSFPKERVVAGMRARLDHYAANLAKPAWERKPPPPLQGDKLVADYVNSLGETLDASFERSQNVFVRDQARMQILGVHAAIHLYRWEHDALPPSLSVLALGPLAVDLFTGKPLAYRATGPTAYEVTSDGLKPAAP